MVRGALQQGRRSMGRQKVRCACLHGHAGLRRNPVNKEFYDRLCAAGKAKKVALTAA